MANISTPAGVIKKQRDFAADVIQHLIDEAKLTDAQYELCRQALAGERFGETRPLVGDIREDGWYWVRKEGWGDELEDWAPAMWQSEYKSWSSAMFSGIPDSEMIVGDKLRRPKCQILNDR